MEQLSGGNAVITGAASGIGLALASLFAREGMKVVLADVEAGPLEAATEKLAADGHSVLAVPTDVTDPEQVEALAARASESFGPVLVLCNNAGVFTAGTAWESSLEDYRWLIDVNLWGVIHGVRAFVPRMIAHGEPAHIVNTASMAGLTALPFCSIYHLTKHAVVAYSESLYHELRLRQTRIGVSVLCPEEVATRIHEAERNRPAALRAAGADPAATERKLVGDAISAAVTQGVSPDVLAQRTLDAIRADRFYILSEEGWRQTAHTRLDDIREGRNPTFAPPVREDA